jgi:hypothetical protein
VPLRNIQKLIDASTELASVRVQAKKQTALQKAFVDYTPVEFADLTKASRVGYIKAGTLFLLADHAATAAKLRQLLPRLLPVFRELEPQVTGIKVTVQVTDSTKAFRKRHEKSLLTIDSIEKFENLSRSINDQNLKLAITNLVRKRSKPKP